MASIHGKFIRGLISNLVYREYRGKQIVQAKPHTPKKHRTEGTKKAANVFGKASKLAAEIRVGLHHVSRSFYDGRMIYRLNTEILHCLNRVRDNGTETFNFEPDSFRSLEGFEFNLNSPLKSQLLVRPNIALEGTTLQVNIPEIKLPAELKFPDSRIERCRLMIVTTMIDLVGGFTRSSLPEIMDIPYSHKPKLVAGQTFQIEVEPGCLCITAISLQYVKSSFAGDVIINSKLFNPTAIAYAAIVEGTVDSSITKDWTPHSYLVGGVNVRKLPLQGG